MDQYIKIIDDYLLLHKYITHKRLLKALNETSDERDLSILLKIAVDFYYYDIIEKLIEKGADINYKHNNLETAFYLAVKNEINNSFVILGDQFPNHRLPIERKAEA